MVQLNEDERVLWSGRPLKMPFLFGVYIIAALGILIFVGLIYLALAYQFWSAFFFAAIFFGILVVFMPWMKFRDWKTTQYTVTNQRVFFDTMIGYDVVRVEDIRDVFIKTGVLDKIYGTRKLFVKYRDFQPTTRYWQPHGTIIIPQGYPYFSSIKNASEVKDLILDIAARRRLQANQ